MDLVKQRLLCWISSSESKEMDFAISEIHLAPNQPVCPRRIDTKGMPEQAHGSSVVGASEINQLAASQRRLFFPAPLWRKATAQGSCFDTNSRAKAMGLDVAGRSELQITERVVMKALPNFGLPASIEALNGGLKAGLQRWSKHRGNPKPQAETNHATDGIGKLVSPLKQCVVVKLRKARQTKGASMLSQSGHDEISADGIDRPGGHQPSVQRDSVEHAHFCAAFNNESLHNIEAIELRARRCDLGQVPTGWRRGAAHSLLSIQSTSAFENAADGAHRGRARKSLPQPLQPNRCGAKFTEVTVRTQLMTKTQHNIFSIPIGATGAMRNTRTVAPVNLTDLTTFAPLSPSLDGGETDVKLACNRSHGLAPMNSFYHGLPSLLFGSFLPMLLAPHKVVFVDDTDPELLASS
jgi:hypothetical protein